MELKHLSHSTFYFTNGFHERLKASLFTQRNSHTTCCIVYLHGFGSHRLEGVTLVSELPKKFAFCCFDFSGSGKSEGSLSAYGIKEYQDISIFFISS
jgi:pimeloyl-ACP methyl ester carboxylesterase